MSSLSLNRFGSLTSFVMKILVSLMLLYATSAFCQEVKVEREWKIKFKDLPEIIQDHMKPYHHGKNKMKCFQEQDGLHNSYEVKLRVNNEWYSIEFDRDSNLEDIELTIDQDQINPSTLEKIKEHLSGFDRCDIDKIQRQFSSQVWADQQSIDSVLTKKMGDIERFEIEVTALVDGAWKSYEMLFSINGIFLSQREILERPIDNVMY